MAHNLYTEEMETVANCNLKQNWTPCDLILREYYNNGGGSAQGFLGISTRECIKCYEFIKENQTFFKENDLINEKGISNYGFTLWENYDIH